MTIVGKILVFMNLLFSVATAALITVVFSTRTNWKTEYERVKNLALVGEAAYKAEKAQHESDLHAKDEQIASLQRERDEQTKIATDARAEAAQARSKTAEMDSRNSKEVSTHRSLEKEVENLKAERDQMASQKAQKEATIIRLQTEVNDNKKIAVQYEVAYKTALTRNEKLLTAYEAAVKENNALKQFQGSGTAPGALTGTINPPPPKDARGIITAVNEQGLAQISIGSDNGLSVGNVLDVFRPDLNNPRSSVYLGRLTLRRVEPKAAVGQFQSTSREKLPKYGDEVAPSVTGR